MVRMEEYNGEIVTATIHIHQEDKFAKKKPDMHCISGF